MVDGPTRRTFLDCASGMSGNMFVAACLDAGLPLDALLSELRKISLGDYDFCLTRVVRGGIAGSLVEIRVSGSQPHRHLADVEQLLESSSLAANVKSRALAMFRRLAEVEGKLHAKPASEVHFHEVGAVDTILDIVGACVAVERLGLHNLVSSPLNVGGGRVEAAHGLLPVPAPATAELLLGLPIYSSGVEAELVTPTGAVIVATLARSFGPMPAMKVEKIGYGAGTRDFAGHPNVARLFLGESAEPHPGKSARGEAGQPVEVVSIIEANLDDMNPELYGYLVERALEAGALDISSSPIQMKKNRPGILLRIIAAPERAESLAELLFDETTTIGVRIYEARRRVLERESVTVETPYGAVRVKVAKRDGRVVNVAPEYEDCRLLARERSVPLKQVMLAAQLAYHQRS